MKRKYVLKIVLVIVVIFIIRGISYSPNAALPAPPFEWELPSLPDYAPKGLPDFSQMQDPTWSKIFPFLPYSVPSWCSVTAAADLLWYLDSKYENGYPGDNSSYWNLVPNKWYFYRANRFPWKLIRIFHLDDHTWEQHELIAVAHDLIECLADLSGTNGWGKIYGLAGNTPESIKVGLETWIGDKGLSKCYDVLLIKKPSFAQIRYAIYNEYGAMIFCEPKKNTWYFPHGVPHAVALQGYGYDKGINTIKISNPASGSNDPNMTTHEIWDVVPSNRPEKSKLMIEDFLGSLLIGPVNGYITYLTVVKEL
jgi:hypothetical protein